jgi:hypothetical protein
MTINLGKVTQMIVVAVASQTITNSSSNKNSFVNP